MDNKSMIATCLLFVLLFVGVSANNWNLFGPQKRPTDQIVDILDEAAQEISSRALKIGFKEPTLADAVDLMAVKLSEKVEQNQNLLNGLADVIQIEDFLSSPLRKDISERGDIRYVLGRQAGLYDAVSRLGPNPYVAKRKIDSELNQLSIVEDKLLHLPLGEKLEFEKAMKLAYNEEVMETTNSCSLFRRRKRDIHKIKSCIKKSFVLSARAAILLCKRVAQVGIMVLDQVYMAPEMVFKLPVVGEKLKELKDKGEPLYDLIKFIRAQHYLLKVKTGNLDTEVNTGKIVEAEKMIGEVGIKAVGAVAAKLMKRYGSVNENERQEVISRTAMAFVVSLLGKGATFDIGSKVRDL